MKRAWMVFGVMVALRIVGAPVPREVAVGRAEEWMTDNPVMERAGRSVASVEMFPGADYSVYVVRLSPAGYLVLNSDDRLPLVVCFSAESAVDLSDVPENAFRTMLLQHVERMEEELTKPSVAKAMEAPVPLAITELYGPFLKTTWNQCNPYNKLCPDDPAGSDYYAQRAPVGCVPVAYAQILSFHRWPLFGEGSRAYTDNSGSITGSHSAVFSDAYDWGSMLSAYDPWDPSPAAAESAVSELMYELGVAVGANYENSGTSASTYAMRQRLVDYFFFEPSEWQSTQSALISPMEADLRAGFPCIVAIPGHAIVADGLMVDDGTTTYHINYGWGGSNNGWWSKDNVAGNALDNGVTSLRPRLLAFPQTNAVAGVEGDSLELQWVLPKRREDETEKLVIYQKDSPSGSWRVFAEDTDLLSRRFSEVTTELDNGDDFSLFEVYSSSGDIKEWAVSNVVGVGNCFSIVPDGYGGTVDHITSRNTITPTASTRLLLRAKYHLSEDRFRVLLSTDRTSFSTVWSTEGSVDWSEVVIDLSDYAGQAVYLRLEYIPDNYFIDGGVWIDTISTQEVTHPELEGQPIHYTLLSNLQEGEHTLAARLTDSNAVEHMLGPEFTLQVPGDGDGMPLDWETRYGLDPNTADGTLDPDGDGYSNFQEYICGTVPTNAASFWQIEPSTGVLPKFYAVEERFYMIEHRTNLLAGAWAPLVSHIPGSNSVVEVDDYHSTTHPAGFYRVEVRKGY